MLGIGCPDRNALPRITLSKIRPTETRAPLPRERVRSWVDLRRSPTVDTVSTWSLAHVPSPANFDVSVLAQPAPPQFPLGDTLKAGFRPISLKQTGFLYVRTDLSLLILGA
jgi:hypothetical protein